ncbi:LAME_0C08988g1_1 [Lachancea meyersii CBS 8951]|uniref:LAME_0C08988g1_1 n=1 Tax=Lachancea meyersii CBS 8951 TaxID=1266667 RepID=A0A1G4J3K6_9SACH|nr:LAME_0C08988g1_1 [Lachancea meyersii CBS 8951]
MFYFRFFYALCVFLSFVPASRAAVTISTITTIQNGVTNYIETTLDGTAKATAVGKTVTRTNANGAVVTTVVTSSATGTGTGTTGTGATGTVTTGTTGTGTTGTGTTGTGTTGTGTTGTGTTTTGTGTATTTGTTAGTATTSAVATTSSATTTVSQEAGTRPDPSTDRTPLPASAVTTLSIESFITLTEGSTTYTTTRAPTWVWVTYTTAGRTITSSTTFVQRYTSTYSVIAEPSSGSIGMGSLTGDVGQVKSAGVVTVSNGAADMAATVPLVGGVLALISWLL